MDHGKNVRGPSLEKGVSYVMKTWGKVPVYNPVVFDGFVSGGQAYKVPTKQLKDMVPTDYYKFTGEEGEFRGKMKDNCLVHLTTEARITFFHLAGVSSDAVTVNADKPAKAPKAPKAAKAPKQAEPKTEESKIEQPAAEEPKAAKSDDAAKERKRAADNERKRQKRAAEKAAKEAEKAPAATEQTEQPAEESTETVEPAEETAEAASEETVEAEHEGEPDAAEDMPIHAAADEAAPAAIA